jgi:hypothetical protein
MAGRMDKDAIKQLTSWIDEKVDWDLVGFIALVAALGLLSKL